MKKPGSMILPSGMRSWQEIGQRAASRPLSDVAWRKRFAQKLGLGTTILLTTVLVFLTSWALWTSHLGSTSSHAPPASSPLQHVEFTSSGVFDENWARQYLNLRDGESLLKYDVFALRRHLLESKQVTDAVVERVLPGTLRIHVTERRPWMRIAADNGAGGYQRYLIARDGMVYQGELYGDEFLSQLPWVAGLPLRRAPDGGLKPLAGMETVVSLLSAARSNLPQLAAQWTVVDLSAYDPRPSAPLSLIKIRTRNLGELVFLAGDFQTQIDRLAFTAHTLQERQMQPARVDLSLDNQVVVQPAVLPAAARRNFR